MKFFATGCLLFSLAIPFTLNAAELEPLKQFINRKPQFISDKSDVQFIATRCSALYLVLSSRTDEASKAKDMQGMTKEFVDRAATYEQVREVLSRATGLRGEPSRNQQKDFAKSYADITLSNWKQSNDLFRGIVGEDLGVCRDSYPYFKKLATNLYKDIKK